MLLSITRGPGGSLRGGNACTGAGKRVAGMVARRKSGVGLDRGRCTERRTGEGGAKGGRGRLKATVLETRLTLA